jgi:ATP-dependent helicase HepA
MLPGQFVCIAGTKEHVGKLVRWLPDGRVEVEWFFSVLKRRNEIFPSERVRVAVPGRQTRCYWLNTLTDCWETGRLMGCHAQQAYIAFPEGDQRTLPEAEVFVRCHCGNADPFDLLRHRFFETPYFHSERHPLVAAMVRRRAATHGLSGLLSSRIRLLDHQIDVIRRVLEDPVQRYLLADEVGLGKTIEAGVIVRQILLDDARARALIITPDSLAAQWQREISEKHRLQPPRFCVNWATHTAPTRRSQPPFSDPYDIVVIDEAHHIARLAYDPNTEDCWEQVRRLCHDAPRLLLLSATPALHNEANFLAMLHLLEPQTYRLEDLDAFKARVANREGVAAVLDLVQEGIRSSRDVRDATEALTEYLGDDPVVAELVQSLTDAAAAREPERIDETVRAIRVHVCETHRVHRRMLRSSRRRVPEELLPKRSNGALVTEWHVDPRAETTQDYLDEWRETAIAVGEDGESLQRVFRTLLRLATTSPSFLRDALRLRVQHAPLDAEAALPLLPASLPAALIEAPLFDGERGVLGRWARELEDDPESEDQIDGLIEVLMHYRAGRNIVFTSYTPVAEEIIARLGKVIHPRHIYSHLATEPLEERTRRMEQFASESDSAVLVCDASAEEGLNLQFAARVFHFDLPEPARLEQRIGRVDRIGRTGTASSAAAMHVLLPDAQRSYAEAFFKLLRDGVGIFSESSADLQFFLEREADAWTRAAFWEGVEGLERQEARVREEREGERRLLRQQAALDELQAYELDDVAFAGAVRAEDEECKPLQDALKRWMCNALHFHLRWKTGGYEPDEHTLMPAERWEPIAATLGRDAPLTFQRDEALRRPDTELIHFGHPFLDAIVDYMRWEDRGQAFAMWRRLTRDEIAGSHPFLRFDLIIDVDPAPLEGATPGWSDVQRAPLLRQAQGWLAPEYVTVYVDARVGNPVSDPALLEMLGWRYEYAPDRRAVDTNLSRASRRPVIADVLPGYERALETGRDGAIRSLFADADRQRAWERAGAHARRTWETRLDQVRRGLIFRGQAGSVDEERALYEALMSGVRQPRVTLDAVGLIILSNENPFVVSEEGAEMAS